MGHTSFAALLRWLHPLQVMALESCCQRTTVCTSASLLGDSGCMEECLLGHG